MYNDYDKGENRITAPQFFVKKLNKQYNTPLTTEYHDLYTNEFPPYFNRYKYQEEEQTPYMNQMSFFKRPRRPIDYIEVENKFDNSQRVVKPKQYYYLNDYNTNRNTVAYEKVFVKRSVKSLRNPTPISINKKHYMIENYNERNAGYSNDRKAKNYFKKNIEHKSYQEEKNPIKFYRNNPLIKTVNYQRKKNFEKRENPLKPIAQKICNIIIKGEGKKEKVNKIIKSEKNEKSSNLLNDLKIEGNISNASELAFKSHNFNKKNSNKYKYHYLLDDNSEENDNEEIEEGILVNERKNDNKMISPYYCKKANQNRDYEVEEEKKERYLKKSEKENENEKVRDKNRTIEDFERDGENEKEGEEEGEIEEENTKTNEKRSEDYTQEVEEDGKKYYEKEKYEKINKRNIKEEEFKVDDQEQVEYTKISKREKWKNDLILKKENEVKLKGIKIKKPKMEIQKVEIIHHESDKGPKHKNELLDVINKDNIEIIGIKKPHILEIKKESNIKLLKRLYKPIIEIENIQNFEQIRNKQKKIKDPIFSIIKNEENNVDIIHDEKNEPKLEIENVENFEQIRNQEKKIGEKIFSIIKNEENNVDIIPEGESRPKLEIENVQNFEQMRNQQKKVKKNIFCITKDEEGKVDIISKDKNEPKLEIEKVQNFEQMRNKTKKIKEQIFCITKNEENNVDILYEAESKSKLEIEKVENFEQMRNKQKKIKEHIFSIIKNEENNVDIIHVEKNEPKLEIEKVQNFEQMRNEEKKNKKDIFIITKNEKYNVDIIPQGESRPKLEIKNVQNFEQMPNKQKKVKEYIFSITKNEEDNVYIKPEQESEPQLEIEKVQTFIQIRNKEKIKNKKAKKNTNLDVVNFKDGNFTLERIEEEPELDIKNVENLEYIENKSKKLNNKINDNIIFEIIKEKDKDIEIIGKTSISICDENSFELKRINSHRMDKSSYRKLKQSARNVYQYKGKQIINDAIITPKETRFIIKGKKTVKPKKGRNIIKREITYFYKSQINPKNKELSIGGKIKNTIKPTLFTFTRSDSKNNDELKNEAKSLNINTINSRKNSLVSPNNNSIKNINSNSYVNSETNTSVKKEGRIRSYKTTTILSSNLVQPQPQNQTLKSETSSIRKYYLNANSNKEKEKEKEEYNNYKKPTPILRDNSSNKQSNEIILKTEGSSMSYRRNKLITNISPSKENEVSNNKSHVSVTNSNSKNQLIKSEEMNAGKIQSYYNNRSNLKKDIPLPKENLKNKSNTVSILPGEKKNMGRTYIYSSTRYDQRPQSNEVKTEKRTYSNNGIIFINENKKNNKSENRNDSNNYSKSNSKKIIISSSLRDKLEDNKENNQSKEIKHNTFYYSSSMTKKKENKPFIDNNQMYISEPSTKDINNNKLKTNLTRIVVTSSDNSPNLIRNADKKQTKDIEPKNMNKLITNSDKTRISADINPNQNENIVSETTKKIDNNEVITEKEIITTTKIEKIVDENKKEEKIEIIPQISNNLDIESQINDANEGMTEDKIFEKYNIPGNDLSDDTKNYLNSYMSSTRPELSDFSKQFLISNVTTSSNTRPELSNITRAYLFSQTPIEDDNDENK